MRHHTTHREHGASLLELLTTVMIIGILCNITMLSFVDFRDSFSQNNTRYQLDSDLRRLRNEAVAAGARGVLSVSSDGKSYTIGLDYSPFRNPAGSDTVIFTRNLPRNVTLQTGRTILFDTRGYVATETGNPVTVTVTLRFNSVAYYSAILYSTGALA